MLFVCCVIEFLIVSFHLESWMFVILSIDANPTHTHDASYSRINSTDGRMDLHRQKGLATPILVPVASVLVGPL
jgi:hypothetical protein